MDDIREARIGGPVRAPDSFGKEGPEFFLVAHDEDKAVAGAAELARHQRWVRRALFAPLQVAGVEIPGREIGEVL